MKVLKCLIAIVLALGAVCAALGALLGAALIVYLDWRDRNADPNSR